MKRLDRLDRVVAALALPALLSLPLTWASAWPWWTALVVPWRPHLGVLLLLLAVLWSRRHGPLALGLAAVGVIHGMVLLHRVVPRSVSHGEHALDVVVFNVQASNPQHDDIVAWLLEVDPDVVVLIELTPNLDAAMAPVAERLPHALTRASDGQFGVGLWSREPLRETARLVDDGYVQSLLVTLGPADAPLRLAASHPPPPLGASLVALRDKVTRRLAAEVKGRAGAVLGDLNAPPWSPSLRMLRRDFGVDDGGAGFGPHPTWPAPLSALGLPIDHVLVTGDVAVTRFETGPSLGSDHHPLLVTLTW